MIRPALIARLYPLREAIAATAATLAAVWLALRGGWFFAAIGGLALVAAGAWLIDALRRRRWDGAAGGEGVVEIDEGAIRYLGARLLGGQIARADLTEIRLIAFAGAPHWRLKTAAEALLIPAAAPGADALAGAFAALPGIDLGALADALAAARAGAAPPAALLWRRPG